jgi:hypothetical protein
MSGKWQGRAVHTPVGPTPYDIHFRGSEENCISGTADNNVSHHTWSFCNNADTLSLDFLSDFRGNDQWIHFQLKSQDGSIIVFRAESHPFMDVVVEVSEDKVDIKIMHYAKLHVEIVLQK